MNKQNDKKDDEEEIVMVGPGADEPDEELDDDGKPEKGTVRKNGKEKDEEEDEVEDVRAGHGEDDEEEDEEEKPNTRESRKARRERQKRARERSQRELKFLRQRNETLEKQHNDLARRVTDTESATIDQRISSLESQLTIAMNVEAEAIKQNEGDEAIEARKIQDKIKSNLDRLKTAKQEVSTREKEGPQVDPDLMFHARSWMEDNPWYDPRGATKDSRVVARLDRQLAGEGYDPKTPEYWDELTKRSKKSLPHRFKDSGVDEEDQDEEERPNKNSRTTTGPRFSTGGRERPLAKNEVYISPDRKKAMQEAGVWDDKVLRTRYLKNYQKWDRENAPRSRDR